MIFSTFRTFCRSRSKFAYVFVNKKVVHVVREVRCSVSFVQMCTLLTIFKKKLREPPKLVKILREWAGKWFKPFFMTYFFHVCVLYARVARLWYALHVLYVTIVHAVSIFDILVPYHLFCLCLQSTLWYTTCMFGTINTTLRGRRSITVRLVLLIHFLR